MILIVDDKQENLFSLKALLQLNNYAVDTAMSGEEALKKILKNEYALIILDVQMPGMDGYEVAEAATGSNKTKNIPVIFLSAVNVDKRFISKGYSSGGVDYVTKPFDPDLLLLKIKTFYRLSEQTRNLERIELELKNEIEVRKAAQSALQNANADLEEKVRERTKELEISNAELQQYAYIASHDLQEPLRKITTFSSLIQERYIDQKGEANDYMEKVIAASERMRRLIQDLLNYSKLSANSYFDTVNPDKLLEDVLSDLEISIKEKEAHIIAGHIPPVEAIPGLIKQLFQNIINNSLKFSRPGVNPMIRIDAERVCDKSIDATPMPDGPYLRITFEDNGIGFNEMYAEKIFIIFQRLHRKEEYTGTGIGLSVVKKIIDKHNGIVSARGRENDGAAFIIVLPVKQENPSTE